MHNAGSSRNVLYNIDQPKALSLRRAARNLLKYSSVVYEMLRFTHSDTG